MRLLVLSDLHLEFGDFAPAGVAYDAVIVAGDVAEGLRGVEWLRKTFPSRPVFYVLGNHEFYKQTLQRLIEKVRAATTGTNIQLLERDRVEFGGVTFLGGTLWTDFNLFGDPTTARYEAQSQMNDFKKIRVLPGFKKLRPSFAEAWHHDSRTWLRQQLEIPPVQRVVVITHHAPSLRSLPEHRRSDPLSPFYASALDAFVEQSHVSLWVHGHIHHSSDYRLGGTRVLSNPRGYADHPNPRFDPGLVIAV